MSGRPRFDFFQTDDSVTITILKKGASADSCVVSYNNEVLVVKVDDSVVFSGRLHGPVVKDGFSVSCSPSKIEIQMKKSSAGRWPTLLQADPTPSSTVVFATKNWDAVEKEAQDEEDNEDLEGDAAVNRMFRKIYEDASDDVKKAMIKSFSESNGTVLSTNWDEIKQKKVDVRPPDCMEFKKYDQ